MELSKDKSEISEPNVLESAPASRLRVGPPIWLRISVWTIAVIAGFLQTWSSKFFFSLMSDGNNYLDVASAYLRHDWPSAINGWWSPMFSWILGALIYLTKLPGYWETPMIHLVNLGAFWASLLCFEFFFHTLLKQHFLEHIQIERRTWWLLGYSLFLSTSLYVLTLGFPTPDIWISAMSYLAAGIVVRIRGGDRRHATFAILGVLLGLGYLFKSFFFPLSFIILLTAWFATGALRKTLTQFILALVVFSAVSAPFISALSRAKHRLTIGDTGRFAYFMFSARAPQPPFWLGEHNTGLLKHPVRQLLTTPRLYEFATPLNASYPPYYDMSYWMDGAAIHFSLRAQLAVLRQSAGTYYQIWLEQIVFSVGLLALAFALQRWSAFLSSLKKLWYVWLPSLFACLGYSIVLTEGRYVASFVLILWVSAFLAGIPSPGSLADRRFFRGVVLAICCVISVRIARSVVTDSIALHSSPAARENVDWEVAQDLRALGILPGDRVAGIVIMGNAHWARLAGIRVVAEIPLGEELAFWSADPALRHKVMDTFASTGARAVVAEAPPLFADRAGWKQLQHTDYYVYLLGNQGIR